MYDYLKGQLVSKQLNSYRGSHIVVEVNNIGYCISTGKRTIEKLEENSEVKIYVSLTTATNLNVCPLTIRRGISKESPALYSI